MMITKVFGKPSMISQKVFGHMGGTRGQQVFGLMGGGDTHTEKWNCCLESCRSKSNDNPGSARYIITRSNFKPREQTCEHAPHLDIAFNGGHELAVCTAFPHDVPKGDPSPQRHHEA